MDGPPFADAAFSELAVRARDEHLADSASPRRCCCASAAASSASDLWIRALSRAGDAAQTLMAKSAPPLLRHRCTVQRSLTCRRASCLGPWCTSPRRRPHGVPTTGETMSASTMASSKGTNRSLLPLQMSFLFLILMQSPGSLTQDNAFERVLNRDAIVRAQRFLMLLGARVTENSVTPRALGQGQRRREQDGVDSTISIREILRTHLD